MTTMQSNANSADSALVDARWLLAKHRMIGVIWCIEDVQSVRPDLTADQAWEILQEAEHRHDGEVGTNWTTLEWLADQRFPLPSYDF